MVGCHIKDVRKCNTFLQVNLDLDWSLGVRKIHGLCQFLTLSASKEIMLLPTTQERKRQGQHHLHQEAPLAHPVIQQLQLMIILAFTVLMVGISTLQSGMVLSTTHASGLEMTMSRYAVAKWWTEF